MTDHMIFPLADLVRNVRGGTAGSLPVFLRVLTGDERTDAPRPSSTGPCRP